MIPVADAIQIVKNQTRGLESERVALSQALGRYLAEDIIADTDLPPFDRSQMDGYAVRAADIVNVPTKLKIVGESAAGRGWHNEMKTDEAVRIMTGAPVPIGADSVQQVELTRELDGGEAVEILEPVTLGRSIVKRGAEIKTGETVLRAGERINAGAVAVLASFGYAQVNVGRRPRVAILATGTELVAVDQKPGQDQIRDSNNFSIAAYALLGGATIQRMPLAGDDIAQLKQQIAGAAERADIIITSGGVSVGRYDFTKTVLKELGAEIFFERVALRPGKPAVFARLRNGALVFGLPGNPVSVSVTFNLFARAAILAMQGAAETELEAGTALLSHSIKPSKDRESYLPARLSISEQAQLLVEPLKWGGSSDFIGFVRATALIIVPSGTHKIDAGTLVKIVYLPQ
ncbi:MAG: molybdopterin molybdotransferase [Pyrinomonadaceae bacterium]|jgi:molybdenum cofactor synthesis domain-containing protein|nr:molybdopterin molybdotransferase [Pyrinomonadaceae bacterium]